MNLRRKLVLALGASALVSPISSLAQPAAKVWRIGFILVRGERGPNEEFFRLGLRELGYVEGQNIAIEWRFTAGKQDLYREFAVEFVRRKVDCIVANGIDAALQAKLATNTIPIVMVGANDDPVRRGLVVSLAHPGGNVTGFVLRGPDLAGKRLQLLTEVIPKLSRIAILWDRNASPSVSHVKESEAAARTLGIQLQSIDIPDAQALESAFQTAVKGRAQALVIVAVGFMNSHQTRIVNLAAKARLPAIYTSVQYPSVGGLMSYAADPVEQSRGAAMHVAKILKGTKPADIPVQQPTLFEFIINKKTANALGIKFSNSMLAQATKVIE